MTTTQRELPQRKLDAASLALTLLGLICGVFGYLLIEAKDYSALLLTPSVIAVTVGVMNITKLEAPRG